MAKKNSESINLDPQILLEKTGMDLLSAYETLTTKTALIQISIVIICYLLSIIIAYFSKKFLSKKIVKNKLPAQILTFFELILERITWVFFPIFLTAASSISSLIFNFSNTYYVYVVAILAGSAVVISILSHLIKNRLVAKILAYSIWSVVALNILGFLDEFIYLLDYIAFNIGDFKLSLLIVLQGIAWLISLLWLANTFSNFLEKKLRNNKDLTPALKVLVSKFVKFTLIIFASIAAISSIGIDLTALTIFSGALGIGIGFGLQKVASNLISGIIILSDRSVKPGDVISLGETFGWINSLNSRYVSIVTRDGIEYLIPNENFVSDRVINWSYSDKKVRIELEFGVSYDSNPHNVRSISVKAISKLNRVLKNPKPVCHLLDFADSSLKFVLRFWIEDPQNGLTNLRGEAYLALWDAFENSNIKIPYPHRKILLENLNK